MAALAAACRARGLAVSGLIQHNEGDCALPGFSMALEDMASGRRIPLVAEGPVPAQACRLDVAGLAEAAACLSVERHQSSDLVIVNKFGRQESLGRGLREEMAALVMAGVPLLTSVRASLLPDFEAFTGEDFVVIDPTAEAVAHWLAALGAVAGKEAAA
jgi:nucleoside-triphosphatase THEP1